MCGSLLGLWLACSYKLAYLSLNLFVRFIEETKSVSVHLVAICIMHTHVNRSSKRHHVIAGLRAVKG